MSYFKHHFASNSDIKTIVDRHNGIQKPDNIDLIYDLGTEIHAGVLERNKLRAEVTTNDQKLLINAMADRFWKDELCRNIVMMPDFKREYEFYRINRFGLEGARCKVDGKSDAIRTILELKGLSVTTEKAFKESILHLNYDQGAAWYLDTATGHIKYVRKLIVGMSKKDPDLLFKVLIDRDHAYYKSGMDKVKEGVKIWKMHGFK
jgi:hypothetical protein